MAHDDLILALRKALPEIAVSHQEDSITWNPHDLVPWDEGKNFAFLGGSDWDIDDSTMSDEVRAAILALLLTKENLPSFHRVLGMHFPPFSEWRDLVGRWTAEDNRHSIALRDHLVVTRQIDPDAIEVLRLAHVTQGYQQNSDFRESTGPALALALMAVHELQASRFARTLATKVETASLVEMLGLVATDDEVQAATFIAFLNAALTADPDVTVIATAAAVNAAVPIGADIENFEQEYALLGEFTEPAVLRAVAETLVSSLNLTTLGGLGAEAESACRELLARANP